MRDRIIIIIIIIQYLYSAIMSYADTEALVAPVCYQIYFDSEQFMWPNIEEIVLTMFLFLR